VGVVDVGDGLGFVGSQFSWLRKITITTLQPGSCCWLLLLIRPILHICSEPVGPHSRVRGLQPRRPRMLRRLLYPLSRAIPQTTEVRSAVSLTLICFLPCLVATLPFRSFRRSTAKAHMGISRQSLKIIVILTLGADQLDRWIAAIPFILGDPPGTSRLCSASTLGPETSLLGSVFWDDSVDAVLFTRSTYLSPSTPRNGC
jgi:hypothetical protein